MDLLSYIRLNVLRRFIDLKFFLQKGLTYDEIIRIELLVAVCLIVSTAGSFYMLIALFINTGVVVIANYIVFFLTAIPIVLYLIKKGKYTQAKLIMMFLGTLFMVIKASSLGPDSGMNLAMLIIVFAIFSFYSLEEYKHIIMNLLIVSASICFLEMTNYSYLGVDKSTQPFEYEFNLVFTILLCVLFFYVILRLNQHMNKKLKILNNKLVVKNAKLAKMNEELDGYVYKASHDIRAPLTSLMGIINLIKVENDPEKIMQYVALQEKCIEKMDSHIMQILDLSKNLKTGLVPLKIDLKALIEEIFLELSFYENAELISKKINVHHNIDYYSDPYRIKIILNNLISNAIKYSKIGNSNPIIEVNIFIDYSHTIMTVKDNGIGITEAQKDKIFDMFYRGTDKSKGAGLGLYIVKEMVNKLKGKISIQSEVNKFTIFKVEIPNLFQFFEKY